MSPAASSIPRRRTLALGAGAALLAAALVAGVALAAPNPPPKQPPAASKPAPAKPAAPAAPTGPVSPITPTAPTSRPAPPPPPPSAEAVAAGKRAFVEVARVLQSPRCQNCHPAGDAPLQTDAGRPHAMNITRASVEAGLACSACHQERNSEAIGVGGGPPGAPHWNLPPKETPMVFEGLSVTALCEQLKDPAKNGKRSLAALHEHVAKDALVLWGWAPGGKRTLPPLPHEKFVAEFQTWVTSGGACP